jgi:hypothetical protein
MEELKMGRIIERRSFESVCVSALILTVFFFTILPSVGQAVDVTVENDAFIRCLIGDCRDTDIGYSPIQDPFESVIFGTDLGTFAAGEFYTYMFLGDTCEDEDLPCNDLDPYLKIPNGEDWQVLQFFITASQEDIAGHEAEFLGYLQHEFNDPFDYLFGWHTETGFHVPTGAFYNTTNNKPYVYYGLAGDLLKSIIMIAPSCCVTMMIFRHFTGRQPFLILILHLLSCRKARAFRPDMIFLIGGKLGIDRLIHRFSSLASLSISLQYQ